ncbi:PAS domain-containing protein [Chachezhania antarctica]|uniref:PAS domain-containing protein n=1 Tax=Chachezhania antarctica TaxID=2340860 RepID=UPI000EAFBA8E|nr:PAS domain-containing protein [Chachezhania antarctica]|tara:strand:+ start:6305 stop:7162 length:858 start_codon:yes stop_codon:yes gene_type:complete
MSKHPTERDTHADAMAGKVVPLFRAGKRRNLTPLRQVEAYWTALREDGDVPRRAEVSPRGLSNLLPDTFILERIARGEARFRIAGSRTTEYAGTELRGMPLTALFSSAARRQVSAVLEEVFSAPAVVELHLTCRPAATLRGKLAASFSGTVEAHAILLPLRSDTGEIARCMGVIVFDRKPVSPLCLDIDTVSIRSVAGQPRAEGNAEPEIAEQDEPVATAPEPDLTPEPTPVPAPEPTAAKRPLFKRPAKRWPVPVAGMAETQEPFKGPGGHLRLVCSNDTLETS